jgi:hypothetical protein
VICSKITTNTSIIIASHPFAVGALQPLRAASVTTDPVLVRKALDEMYGTRLERVVESLLARQAFCIIADKQNFDAAACWEQLLCTPRHIRRG